MERWYRNGVVYSLDVRTFQDSNGDGIGDLPGLTSRLDYLSRLGVTALWLGPIHPSPQRDGGYDVADQYGIDPTLGSLGDFAELMNRADERGLRIILDLVVNHTSDEHPWFQAARRDRRSPFRDWYVWADEEPTDRRMGMVFPGVQEATWTYDEVAGAWFHHRFYDFEPDLDIGCPAVRQEIRKIVSFWQRLGVGGFRVDAAPFAIECTEPGREVGVRDYDFLTELREHLSWHGGDAVFLAEANVENGDLLEFFGSAEGAASRLHMLFAFGLNEAIMLSLARQDRRPVTEALRLLPDLPRHGQWATFLRNHDEVDLSGLAPEDREAVFAAFGPDEEHRLYGRGIRRRLAPMLDGDQRRIRLAYSLQLTMPGTPVIRYGDEIGMGEDLSLPERTAIRTPMQWAATDNAGFSTAAPDQLVRPVVSTGPFGYEQVNVTDQRRNADSLLVWFERVLHTVRECEEVGIGRHEVVPVGPAHVLVHQAVAPSGTVVFAHNLAPDSVVISLPELSDEDGSSVEIFSDREYPEPDLRKLELDGYGYRWIRLRRTHAHW